MTAVLFGWLVQAEHSFILLLSLGEVAACWEEATRQLWVSVMPKWANASVAGRWVEGSLHSGLVTSCPHPLVLIQSLCRCKLCSRAGAYNSSRQRNLYVFFGDEIVHLEEDVSKRMFESGWHQHITDVWGSQLGQKYEAGGPAKIPTGPRKEGMSTLRFTQQSEGQCKGPGLSLEQGTGCTLSSIRCTLREGTMMLRWLALRRRDSEESYVSLFIQLPVLPAPPVCGLTD
eukprot:1158670-Pelagomonas_calceolata.AAC.1